MPLDDRNWTTSYPVKQDTIGVEQPDLIPDSYDGARDGHRVLVSHLHSLRNKVQDMALLVGDSGDLPAGTSLRSRVTTLEGASGTDADAIHDNVAAEINAITSKGTPVGADVIVLEDSADSWAKKKATITSLPGGGPGSDTTAIHDDTAGEINAITTKGTPVGADVIVLEDSAAGFAKKKATITSLPSGSSTFTALTDTPSNYTGSAGKYSKVNSGETALEFVDVIPVPNAVVYDTAAQISGTYIESTASYVQFYPAASGSNTIDIPVTGLYRCALRQLFWGRVGESTFEVKVVLDQGLGTEIVIGDSNDWRGRVHNAVLEDIGMEQFVNIPAKSYTLKAYFKTVTGSANHVSIIGTGTIVAMDPSISFELQQGSGAGGILDPVEQILSTLRNITSTSAAPIPTEPMTVTFEANAGEVVLLGYKFRAVGPGGADTCKSQMRLDGSLIGDPATTIVAASAQEETLNEARPYKMTTGGTHTLDLYCWTLASQAWNIDAGAHLFAMQYRGGLVPYRNSSDILVQDKPTSVKAGEGIEIADSDGQVVISSNNIAVTSDLNFSDALDDNILNSNWTKDIPTVGSVVEQNGRLEIGHTGGTALDWFTGNYNAPGVYADLKPFDFTMKVYAGNLTATNLSAAMLLLYEVGDKTRYIRIDHRYDGSYRLATLYNNTGVVYQTVGQNGMWLGLIRRGGDITVYYSTNSLSSEPEINDMTFWRTIDSPIDFSPNRVGLYTLIAGSNPATTVHFNNFSLVYESETAAKFNMPENIPILEYNAAGIVNVIAAPGASTRLVVTLNDGAQYEAASPLTCNMATSGRGGLEASASETANTFYYNYAVKSLTAGEFVSVFSPNAPSDGGPDDFDAWRYLGVVRNDSSSDFIEFNQDGNHTQYKTGINITGLTIDGSWYEKDLSAYVPKTCGSVMIFTKCTTVGSPDQLLIRPSNSSGGGLFITADKESVVSTVLTPSTSKAIDYAITTGATATINVLGWYDDHLAKNRTMPVFSIGDAYKGHIEDTPPAFANTNDNEWDEGILGIDWDLTTVGAGAPSGSEAISYDNERLAMRITGDGNTTTNPQTKGHCPTRSAITTGIFTIWTKPYIIGAEETRGRAGLILGASSITDGLYVAIGNSSTTIGIFSIYYATRTSSGAWSVTEKVIGANRDVVLSIKYNVSTGAYELNTHIDQNTTIKATSITGTLSFTPSRMGVFGEYNASSSNFMVTGFEWFRVSIG
jgi:hypothetical protein